MRVRFQITTGFTPPGLMRLRTGVGANCGSCLPSAEAILDEARARRELPLPVLAQAA